MAKETLDIGCSCSPHGENRGACTVEAMISIDTRGQMILPKNVREKLDLLGGGKVVIVSWEKDGETESLSIIPDKTFSKIISNYYSKENAE